MITLEEQLLQVIYVSVTRLNGLETEEELNMLISETIARENLEEIKKNLIAEQLDSELDTEQILSNGAYIYSYKSLSDWEFKRVDTIADAVREAVKLIDATILYNGNVITYDTINSESAYYIDNDAGKVKIVQLCA